MGIIVDLLLLAVVIYFVVIGMKRGFVRTLLSFLSKIASAFVAVFVTDKYDDLIYGKFFKESVISSIDEHLSASVADDVSQQISDVLKSVPGSASRILEALGIDFSSLGDFVSSSMGKGEASDFIEQTLAGPITVFVCRIIIFAIAFALLSFVFGILINVVCRIVELPVLRTANKALGGVLGLLNGLIIILVLSYVCIIVSVFLDNSEFSGIINDSQVIEILTSTMNGFIGV